LEALARGLLYFVELTPPALLILERAGGVSLFQAI